MSRIDQPISVDAGDAMAFGWLAAIERLDWKTTSRAKGDGQITIRMCPHGNLRRDDGSAVGAMVMVYVSHPKTAKRVRGSGNTLMGAVNDVWRQLYDLGVSLPPPDQPNVTQAEWAATIGNLTSPPS